MTSTNHRKRKRFNHLAALCLASVSIFLLITAFRLFAAPGTTWPFSLGLIIICIPTGLLAIAFWNSP